jgi:hypothetical protein
MLVLYMSRQCYMKSVSVSHNCVLVYTTYRARLANAYLLLNTAGQPSTEQSGGI